MNDILQRLTDTLEARKGAAPESSYVAKLYSKGDDAILKKVIEEAGEVLLAAKDGDKEHLLYEVADLWFHSMVLLAHKGLTAEIPCRKVYEDDDLLAFHDINPVAPVHFMMVPKSHLASLMEAEEGHAVLLGRMLLLAPKLAKEQGLDNGFRTVINTGKAGGQEVFHLHIHIIGGGNIPPMVKRS